MRKINLQFFAQVIDLTDKLSEEKSTIKIHDDVYEVNDGFKTILEVDSLMKNNKKLSQVEQLTKMFEALFGKDSAAKLLEKNYKLAFYKKILESALAVIKDDNDDSGK